MKITARNIAIFSAFAVAAVIYSFLFVWALTGERPAPQQWFTAGAGDTLHNRPPALELPRAGQKVYVYPDSVSLTLEFEQPIVEPRILRDSIMLIQDERAGIVHIGWTDDQKYIWIVFDPYYMEGSEILESIYPPLDDKQNFL
jgi:hypothetical protein